MYSYAKRCFSSSAGRRIRRRPKELSVSGYPEKRKVDVAQETKPRLLELGCNGRCDVVLKWDRGTGHGIVNWFYILSICLRYRVTIKISK